MIKRLLKAGKRVVYIPDAKVEHKVEPDRMKLEYLRKWQYGVGASFVRVSKRYGKVPNWMIRQCIEGGISALWNYLLGRKLQAIAGEEKFWSKLGTINEMRKRPQ